MIGIFKRLIAWFLEKIAGKIPDPPKPTQEGYFQGSNEETLQSELKKVLLRSATALRKKKEKPEPALDENGNPLETTEQDKAISEQLIDFLLSCKERILAIPRWVKLIVIATIPVCLVYIILYIILVSPPDTNIEEEFRYSKGKPLVRIGYIKEWPTSTVITSLLSEALDTNLNVDITTKDISQNNLKDLWQLMVTNRADITPSVWLPNTHAAFIIDAGDEVVDLGVWLSGARLGLVVPDYMGINSIEELSRREEGGIIYGIDPSSKLHHMTERAIELYGLKNYRIIAKNDKYMVKRLEEAIKNKEDIIVAAWTPHWIFGEWKIRMLDDPLKVFGSSEEIHIYATANFKQNFPDICSFLANIELDLQEFSDLLASARRLNSSAAATNRWLLKNQRLVLDWDLTEE